MSPQVFSVYGHHPKLRERKLNPDRTKGCDILSPSLPEGARDTG